MKTGASRGWEEGPLALFSGVLATEVVQWQTFVVPLWLGCKVTIGLSRVSTGGLLCHGTSARNHSCWPVCIHPGAGDVRHCCSSQMKQTILSHQHYQACPNSTT